MSSHDRPIPYQLVELSTPPAGEVDWLVRRVTTDALRIEYNPGHEPRFKAQTAFVARRMAAVALKCGPEDLELELAP